jgi:predicted dehydrogenase
MHRLIASSGNRPSRLLMNRILLLGLLLALPGAMLSQTQETQPAPLRVAIIGLVHGHVEGFLSSLPQHKNVALVGIADPDPALSAKYAKQFSLPQSLFFTNADEMINASHPQALLVYTSVAGHRQAIETAARHGIPVMVEKPLTISLDDALAIRKTAREHHIHVLVNYVTTWYASNHAAYDEAESGRLGEIRRIVAHNGHEGPKEIGVGPKFLNWLTDPAQNGAGALYDFGCYGADLTTWLMHGEAPLTVTAIVNHDKPQIYPNVDDDATIVLAYPHAQAVLQASWNWPFSRTDLEVYGATGFALTVGTDKLRLRKQHDGDETITAPALTPPQDNSLDYLAAVLNGQIESKGDLTALDTNVVVMQILDAARTSARTGKSIKLTKLPD